MVHTCNSGTQEAKVQAVANCKSRTLSQKRPEWVGEIAQWVDTSQTILAPEFDPCNSYEVGRRELSHRLASCSHMCTLASVPIHVSCIHATTIVINKPFKEENMYDFFLKEGIGMCSVVH